VFELIRVNTAQQGRLQRITDIALTGLMWAVWLLLWLPLIPLVGWMLGHSLTEFGLEPDEGIEFVHNLKQFFINVSLIGVGLITWSAFSLFASRWKQKRKSPFPVTREQQARRFGVSEQGLAVWQTRPIIEISFYEDGSIESITPIGTEESIEAELPVETAPSVKPEVNKVERENKLYNTVIEFPLKGFFDELEDESNIDAEPLFNDSYDSYEHEAPIGKLES
jgi:poly-beta-1,6-N-acetyl-D-glucosamine biosynthesis protein PgaD